MASYLPVLTFHMIEDKPSVLSYSPYLFKRFMEQLRLRGYKTINLTEAVGTISTGNPLPEKTVILTFDDGYASVYEKAFPVLEEYGMSATVFLTVGDTAPGADDRLPSLNGADMLRWREIRNMRDGDIEFGSHTLTHPDLTRLDSGEIEHEIRQSKEIIEDFLGTPVSSFAYPYGRYNEESMKTVCQYYDCACSDELGLLTQKSRPYAVERVDSYYLRSESVLKLLFTGLFPTYVLLRNVPRRIKRSLGGW